MDTVLNDAILFAKRILDNKMFLFEYVTADMKIAEDKGENPLAGMNLELERAAQNPDTNDHDVLISIAADLSRDGSPHPSWMGKYVADFLEGKRKRPTKRGLDKYKNWERNYKLFIAVVFVAQKFNLPSFTTNELSKKTTAADIISKASNLKVDTIIKAYNKVKQLGENF